MKMWLLFLGFCGVGPLMAEDKMSFDVTVDKLNFVRPLKGIGKAGTLIFKSASVFNNGIVLNVNNVNNYFDSQIFVRPTFLGFTTQFGNFGFGIEADSLLNSVLQTDLANSKFIMDDNQLTLTGESMYFVNSNSNLRLKGFRLYCQNNSQALKSEAQPDVLNSCYRFMTLNGTYQPGNELAQLELKSFEGETKTVINATVNSIDLRHQEIMANLPAITTISNESYVIEASNVLFSCAKDADLNEFQMEKIKTPCFNQLRVNPMQAVITDKKEKSKFKLDIKNIVVQDKIFYLTLNKGVLSDPASSTYLTNVLVNCKKNFESDLFEMTDVLKDCIEYGRVSIGEVRSDKADEKKDSYNRNVAVSVSNGTIVVQSDIKFLGFNSRVSIHGSVNLDADKRQLILKVTDTKLPLGLTSVKLLMHFLKKDLISKDVSINNNVITISL